MPSPKVFSIQVLSINGNLSSRRGFFMLVITSKSQGLSIKFLKSKVVSSNACLVGCFCPVLGDFDRFAKLNPNFAEDYIYPDMVDSETRVDSPSTKAPNGFCTDFTPDDIEATHYHNDQKKTN